MRPYVLFFVCFYVMIGCTSKSDEVKKELNEFPFKIGVLGDTQITTDKETYQYLSFRSPKADKVSPVSLRPPALEYLSTDLLNYFLTKLSVEESVDIILYLGDGANSGCQDELRNIFDLLSNVRDKYSIPTYYIIGNHDYLGTGNQTLRSIKKKLCGRDEDEFANGYVDKDELIKMVVSHNRASAKVDDNFKYIDVEPNYSKVFDDSECDTTHNQIYYAAALKSIHPNEKSVDILLADTSDYNNVWFRPIIRTFRNCEIIGGAGLKGSMSYEQIQDLQMLGCNSGYPCDHKTEFMKGINPQFGVEYRIVASHYDPASFNALYPWNLSPSFVKDNLGYLLSDGDNVWLGAHHHSEEPRLTKYPVGKSIFDGPKGIFHGFSVGSTTDYNPHVAIIEASSSLNTNITENVSYRTIEAPQKNILCEPVLNYVKNNIELFEPIVCGSTHRDINSILGINKLYDKPGCWNKSAYDAVRGNVDKLIDNSTIGGFSKEAASLCLAISASSKEKWE